MGAGNAARGHWMRNALAQAAARPDRYDQDDLRQETAETAHQRWEQIADALTQKVPEAGRHDDGPREDALAYMPSQKVTGRRSPKPTR